MERRPYVCKTPEEHAAYRATRAGYRPRIGKTGAGTARGGPPAAKATTAHLKKLIDRREAYRLKIGGATYQQIADTFGWGVWKAHNEVMLEADVIAADTDKLRDQARKIEGERLDFAQRHIWPIVQGDPRIKDPEKRQRLQLQAVDRLIRLSQRRSALFGLNIQPDAVENAPVRDYAELSDAELEQRIKSLQAVLQVQVNVNMPAESQPTEPAIDGEVAVAAVST